MPKSKTQNRPLVGFNPFIPIAGLTAVGLVYVAARILPAEYGSQPYLGAVLRVWVFVLFAIGAVTATRIKDANQRARVLAVLVGVCLAGIVLLGLKNTSYGLNGVGGDQGLQTAQVTKFAEYAWTDFAYKDLPPFYPPAYFFALGKVAALFGIEPYRMLKYGLVAIAFLLPILLRKFWKPILPAGLLLAAVLSALLYQDWYKPYEWLALVLFIPWWLQYVEGIGAATRKLTPGWLLLGALIGGLLFATYYYWFFIGAVVLLIRVVWPAFDGKRSAVRWRPRLLVLGGAALVSSPYWGSLLASMLARGSFSSLQNRYFLDEFNVLLFPFLDFSVLGLVSLAGLLYLLQNFQRDRIASSLLLLVVAAYVWQLVGYVGFLADTPLLTFKARDLVTYILGLAALLGAFEFVTRAWRTQKLRRQYGAMVAGGAVIAALFFGQNLAAGFADHELLQPALDAQVPQQLISDYNAAIGGDGRGRVILGDGGAAALSIYQPNFQFLSWAAVFSHPAGEYYERVEFLQALSRAEQPGWFAAALMNNRFDHVDQLILLPVEGGYTFGYLPESFPARSETEHIFFPASLFDPAYFEQTPVGQFVMFTPIYAKDPLAQLHAPDAYEVELAVPGIGDGDELYEFMRRFSGQLDFANDAAYWRLLSDRFGS